MDVVRITREFHFEMAHSLLHYDGPCKNVHGHSYKLFVTLIGKPRDEFGHPKNGMVMDFGLLKKIVNAEIIERFDHAVAVWDRQDKEKLAQLQQLFGNCLILDYQPTCELLVSDFARRLKPHLPKEISLHQLKLYETANSYAEWVASDNP